ncbi:MAG: hypothetical protein ACT4PI_18455 [Actinomycetota bacterium]
MRSSLVAIALVVVACSAAPSTKTPPAGTGDAPLYVSFTMHIESTSAKWPDTAALLELIEATTAAGVRWSIGTDVGWLEDSPDAAEFVAEASALGVQWDVHTHVMTDKNQAVALLADYGATEFTGVVSGVTVPELDALAAYDAEGWTPTALWGINQGPNHGPGSDDDTVGVWACGPDDVFAHDADAPWVCVGGGDRSLAGAEAVAADVAAGEATGTVVSTTVMIRPETLTTHDGGDLDDILAFVERMDATGVVEWATIAETAAAWSDAGGEDSRL